MLTYSTGTSNTSVFTHYSSTSTWPRLYNEKGTEILRQIQQVSNYMMEYSTKINGVIFAEIMYKLCGLLAKVNEEWGWTFYNGTTSTYNIKYSNNLNYNIYQSASTTSTISVPY